MDKQTSKFSQLTRYCPSVRFMCKMTTISFVLAFLVSFGTLVTTIGCPANLGKNVNTYESSARPTSCIAFYNIKKEFHEAEKICHNHGGYLVSIHSFEENQDVLHLLRNVSHFSGNAWIGLEDREVEDIFNWVDGSKLDFEYWGKDEGPRTGVIQHRIEDCVAINTGDEHWHDYGCERNIFGFFTSKLPFVCQLDTATKKSTPAATLTPTPTQQPPIQTTTRRVGKLTTSQMTATV